MNTKYNVSVVIATRNRKNILKKCLRALNKQNYDHNKFEVIIIDDGSTVNNKSMINKLNLDYSLTYKYQKQTGPAGARNKGIRLAKSDYIIFIDDDIIVNKDFIKSHMNKHSKYNNIIVHGPVIYTNNIDKPTSAQKKIKDFSNAFFATGNASIKKDYLFKAGLFNEKFYEYGWEDLEFGKRLKKLNLKSVQAKNAKGYHLKHEFSPEDIPKIREQEKQRGRMAVLYHDINPTFSVKTTTLYWKPTILLIKLLTFKNWPRNKNTKNLIEFFHNKSLNFLRNFILYFIKLDSYLIGLNEGYEDPSK